MRIEETHAAKVSFVYFKSVRWGARDHIPVLIIAIHGGMRQSLLKAINNAHCRNTKIVLNKPRQPRRSVCVCVCSECDLCDRITE